MSIAQVLCGFSLGQADSPATRHGQEEAGGNGESSGQQFIDGAAARGIDTMLTEHIFGLVEKFAGLRIQQNLTAPATRWFPSRLPG